MHLIKKRFFIALGVFLIILSSFLAGNLYQLFSKTNVITIGAKNCSENQIVAEIFAILIEKKSIFKVKRKFNFEGTFVCFEALKAKDIDLYLEYTGTAYYSLLKEKKYLNKLDTYEYVKNEFFKRFNILWLSPLGFENSYVLLTTKEKAKNISIEKISDLKNAQNLKFAFDPEFLIREEFSLLRNGYNLNLSNKMIDQSLLYISLKERIVDIISGFSTDSKIKKYDLVVLKDDKNIMPTYLACPIIKQEVFNKHSFIKNIFDELT